MLVHDELSSPPSPLPSTPDDELFYPDWCVIPVPLTFGPTLPDRSDTMSTGVVPRHPHLHDNFSDYDSELDGGPELPTLDDFHSVDASNAPASVEYIPAPMLHEYHPLDDFSALHQYDAMLDASPDIPSLDELNQGEQGRQRCASIFVLSSQSITSLICVAARSPGRSTSSTNENAAIQGPSIHAVQQSSGHPVIRPITIPTWTVLQTTSPSSRNEEEKPGYLKHEHGNVIQKDGEVPKPDGISRYVSYNTYWHRAYYSPEHEDNGATKAVLSTQATNDSENAELEDVAIINQFSDYSLDDDDLDLLIQMEDEWRKEAELCLSLQNEIPASRSS
ncbi:hypothetical protein M422DRAFT_239117 [Sphaerobolus stellatus SS14]|nr:hypothetical protein M422DRAFT_239117 [Sphaerobolus stellatus SS14]